MLKKLDFPQDEAGSAPGQDEPPRIRTLEPVLLEKIVKNLIPAHRNGDPFYVPAFMYTYRKFTSTGQVLDLLFKRYGFFHPNCEEDEQVKNTICSLFAMWLDKYPEDFCQSKNLANLNKLMAYVTLHMPSSDLAIRVQHLQAQLVELETNETGTKHEEPLDLGLHNKAAPELKAMDPAMTSMPLVLQSTLPALARDLGHPEQPVPHVKIEYFVSAVEQSEHLLCPVDLQPMVATALDTHQAPGIKTEEEVDLLSFSADTHLDLPTPSQINLHSLVEEKLA